MKYTRDEALKEIRRRAKVIRQKRDRKMASLFATTACISLIALALQRITDFHLRF